MPEIIKLEHLSAAAGVKPNANMRSVKLALDQYGAAYGLNRRHRLAHYLAQLLHESGNFRYDREVWGPTAAQQRYDTRVDLGNTPEVDGDGKKNAGRGPIQLTGAGNIARFYAWAVKQGMNPPDFRENPDLINTDPWEGLSAIWYWAEGNPTGKSLNRYSDENNHEIITRRINGGLNGYPDRLAKYDRIALVLAGYGPTEIERFQKDAKRKGLYTGELDGESGPKTRAALHLWLAGRERGKGAEDVVAAPVTEQRTVVEEKEVPVVPEGAEKRGGLWGWGTTGIGAALASIASGFMDLPTGWKVALAVITLAAIAFLLWRGELVVRRIKSIVAEIGK